jgi:hypothetical protein
VATITDDDSIVTGAATDANGFTLSFESWVEDLEPRNIIIGSAGSIIAALYYRGAAGQVLTVGVKDFAGVALPAATNDYTVTVSLRA